MNSDSLPDEIIHHLNGWISQYYEVCHFWCRDVSNYYVYYVVVYYDYKIHFFRFWGTEKDGFDMSKDNTFYLDNEE